MSNTPTTDNFGSQWVKPGLTEPERIDEWVKFAGTLEIALRAVLADPHGCRFCDSGKLRNPEKPHDDTCGYALAAPALSCVHSGNSK